MTVDALNNYAKSSLKTRHARGRPDLAIPYRYRSADIFSGGTFWISSSLSDRVSQCSTRILFLGSSAGSSAFGNARKCASWIYPTYTALNSITLLTHNLTICTINVPPSDKKLNWTGEKLISRGFPADKSERRTTRAINKRNLRLSSFIFFSTLKWSEKSSVPISICLIDFAVGDGAFYHVSHWQIPPYITRVMLARPSSKAFGLVVSKLRIGSYIG